MSKEHGAAEVLSGILFPAYKFPKDRKESTEVQISININSAFMPH